MIVSVSGVKKAGHLHGVSFDLHAGEILGIAGVLGSGKSTLAKIVSGSEAQDSARDDIRGAVKTGFPLRRYAPRGGLRTRRALGRRHYRHRHDREQPDAAQSASRVAEIPGHDLAIAEPSPHHELDRLSAHSRVRPHNMCRTLSGGNQQRIVFAKWLARNVNVFICDDPGRGLDVGAKEDIYQLLRELAKDGAGSSFSYRTICQR